MELGGIGIGIDKMELTPCLALTMADFVVEKYDGGVKKPSQSIKIYRKSFKSLRNVIN